jgi:putative membrane protein
MINIISFLVSLAITHTFIDFIPSIYLGAPDEDNSISVLPGHQMLLEGKAHHAVILTSLGSIIGVFLLIPIVLISFVFLPLLSSFAERIMAWILIWVSFFLLYYEKENKKISFVFFLLAGFLGIASSNLQIGQPLLPLLSGLFGGSSLIYSISQNTKIPPQLKEKFKIKKQDLIKPSLISSIVSPLCSFLPGLGSSQAAVVGLSCSKNTSKEQFLVLTGSIGTLVMAFSFYTLYIINKSRSGIAGAISDLTNINSCDLIIISFSILVSSILAFFMTIYLSKKFTKYIEKINYPKLSKIILLFLVCIVFAITGLYGLFVFFTSTILGVSCVSYNVKRSFLMGCLIIPTIIYYLPFL